MKKLLMALVLLPLMAAAETWYDPSTGYTWTYSLASVYGGWGNGCEWFDIENDSVVLEAVSPIPNGELRFPSQINGHLVEVLGGYFMEDVDSVKRVVFPPSMKYVCDGVFNDCLNLTEVVLNDGFLGGPRHYKAFGNCAVSKWELPASMRYMNFGKNPVDAITIRGGNNNCYCVKNGILLHSSQADGIYDELCFVPRKVTAFEVGEEIRLIDRYAFYYNEMQSCDLSKTKIVCLCEAFKHCPNLKSVKFPASLQEIDGIPFENCNLDRVTFEGAVPKIWDEFNPPDVSDGWYCCLYAAHDHYRKINGNIITYVLPNKGWDDIVATGTWQGRPIRYVSEGPIQETFLPGEAVSIDTALIGYTAKGLPSGLKYDKKTGKITGAAKKPTAAEGVTVKFTKKGEPDAEIQIVVGPMPKLSIALEGDTEKCKVKGAGDYLVGKKVSLSATAPKGTAFVGWFVNGAPWPSAEESKNAKLSYVMTKADVSLVAKFEKEQMSVGCAGLEGKAFTVGVAGGAGIPLEIETQSGVKSVKVSKLPAGMKYNAKTGLIEGAPTKAGDYTVQIAVTAKSGAVEKKDIAICVDPLPDWAVGTFSGMIGRRLGLSGEDGAAFYGSLQFTVKATGAVSAKVTAGGKTYSFSAKGFRGVEDGDAFLSRVNYPDADEVACRVSDTLVLDLATKKGDALLLGVTLFQKSGHLCVAKVGGMFVRSGCDSPYGLVAWRNEAGKDSRIAPGSPAAEAVARLKNLGKVYLKARELEPRADGARHFSLDWWGGEPLHRYGSKEADVTLSVDKSGIVKVSGKIDGVKLTASTPLRFSGNEWFSVTADSIAYDKKSGMDYEFMLGWDTVNPHTGVVSVTPDPNADPLTAGPDMHEFELWVEPFE